VSEVQATARPGIEFLMGGRVDGEIIVRHLSSYGTLRIDQMEGSKKRSSLSQVTVRPGVHSLIVNWQGAQLIRASEIDPWRIVAPFSVVYLRGPIQLQVHIGRGTHDSIIVSWNDADTPALSQWVDRMNAKELRNAVSVAFVPVSPWEGDVAGALLKAVREPSDFSEPIIYASIHEMVARIYSADTDFCLATLPLEVPETLMRLIEKVRVDPTIPWSLKEAAAFAGYSPFHLSRTFKASIGYGFPEFVDRCRTEIAVRHLSSSEAGIDDIASASGFGSTQALRESVREYLGLLPSELRLSPLAQAHRADAER